MTTPDLTPIQKHFLYLFATGTTFPDAALAVGATLTLSMAGVPCPPSTRLSIAPATTTSGISAIWRKLKKSGRT